MIKNYIVVALRNITKYRIYSLINILGLSIGITCSLLLLLYVRDEVSYDGFHSKAEQIYRVVTRASIQDTKLHAPVTMAPMGPALKNDYAEVEHFTRITGFGETLVTNEDIKFYEDKFYFVDSSFFEIFDFELIQGNPITCLQQPGSLVLTETLARKYFGTINPMGKTLKTETPAGEETRKVTGVMADPPSNSHLRPNALISYSSLPEQRSQFWGNLNDYTYVVLTEGTDPDQFNKYFPDVYDKYVSEIFNQFNAQADFYLQPLSDIHLFSNLEVELEPAGDVSYIYIFTAIAIFMLVVACINYMNLATARSANRAKEVGVRKAMGSYKSQLVSQFLSESLVLTLLAVVISGIVVFFLIPEFNVLSGKQLSQNFIADPIILIGLLSTVIFVGGVGGSYPALYLSRFRAADVLSRNSKAGGGVSLRRILVIIQFSISLIMIISTWVVFDQLRYIQNKNLGFNKDRVVKVLLNGEEVRDKYQVLKVTLLQNPAIEAVGSTWSTPGGNNFNLSAIKVEANDGAMIDKVFQAVAVDSDFIPTLEMELVAGRNFHKDISTDTSTAVIVNQKMVEHMDWDEPLGKKFGVVVNEALERREVRVVGVVGDFHLRSLHEPIAPLVIHNANGNGNMVIRIAKGDIQGGIRHLQMTWDKVVTNKPMQYSFIEQDLDEQYRADQKRGEVFAIFSMLTIVISCLGLFGLASFTAESKRKEIGIRKVIGASVPGILFMMSRDFLKLIAVAVVISFPLAYYFMDQWLSEFAFRSEMSAITFGLSALLTVVITVITISYHSLTAATSNPTRALREQ